MNNYTFNVIVINSFDRCIKVLEQKRLEYAPGEDRLEAFKQAAELQQVQPEQALWGMITKHLTSLNSMCKLAGSCATPFTRELWEEKLTDAHNYLFLLEALVNERYDWYKESDA